MEKKLPGAMGATTMLAAFTTPPAKPMGADALAATVPMTPVEPKIADVAPLAMIPAAAGPPAVRCGIQVPDHWPWPSAMSEVEGSPVKGK